MKKWIAEFELEDGDTMPEHMDLTYGCIKLDFHCRPITECEDAISRQAAQEGLNHLMDSDGFRDSVGYVQKSLVRKMLVNLPPVQQKPKTGHWIIIDDCELFMAKCSECGEIVDSRMISKYPYCHCGAKMIEPQESEE